MNDSSEAAIASAREWTNVDRARFEREVVPRYEPALLRGFAGDWPIVAAARRGAAAHYLADIGRPAPVEMFEGAPDMAGHFFYDDHLVGFNFTRRRTDFLAALRAIAADGAVSMYLGAAPARSVAPSFTASHPMPLVDASVEPRIWIGTATHIATHFDLADNIAVAVAGPRRFTLFPPNQVANLYVGPLEHTIAGQPVSMVRPDAPDLERFPRYAEALANARVADLEPGDALFVPSLWWHNVRATAPFGVLVNYWWGQADDSSPFEALLHALLAVRDLPAGQRDGWSTLFEHFVFNPGQEPAAHLPPAARGVQGPESPERSRLLRAFLLGSLAKRGTR